jgi:hypothetical protein
MVLEKEVKENIFNSKRGEATSYRVQDPKRLHKYMHEELATTIGEQDEGLDLDEALGVCHQYDLSTDEVAASASQSITSSSSYAANPDRVQLTSMSLL